MNDNWSEIIEILRPIIGTRFTKNELKSAVEACLRMIGWKTSNKSMISNYQTESGKNIDLVLGEKMSEDEFFPVLPIAIFQENSYSKNIIFENMKILGSKVGIGISKNIEIYYQHDKDIPNCVCKIAYDIEDENGSLLVDCIEASKFKESTITNFAEELYQNINPEDRLNDLFSLMKSDKSCLKNIIVDYFVEKGFDATLIKNKIDGVSVIMCDKGTMAYEETTHSVKESIPKYLSTAQNDTTKFSIDGVNYLSKRNFVLEVVKKYVYDHDWVDYNELEKVFPSEIISKMRGVVRPLSIVQEWIKKQPDLEKRYCMKSDEIIRLKDGKEVVVYNQWGSRHFPSFLEIAKSLYTVTSNRPYTGIEPVEERGGENTGITISEKSLETFSKKK